MLQAMNTGHDGSLTTTHANSPRDAISRLETLTLMSGFDLPLKVIREQIASAVDLVVQVTRMRDGSRKITSITEIVGMEGDIIVMNEFFKFEEHGSDEDHKVEGEFISSGMRPMFEPRLKLAGFKLPPEMFGADRMTIKPPRRR
jgi:pilus assembly protein CpaF